MKIFFTILALVLCAGLNAQQPKPSFEKKGDMVLATYYHENGQIAQKGYFLDGKLHGEWQMFDAQGNKTAMGHYAKGSRTGKWYFYEAGSVKEVEFADNAIASVVTKEKADPVVVQ